MVAFLLLATLLSACGVNSSEPPTSQNTDISNPSINVDETPVETPTRTFTIADPYDGDFWNQLNLTLEGSAMRDHLKKYVEDRFVGITYSAVGDAVLEMDEDPDNKDNVISLYDLQSMPKTEKYKTWNREHTYPQSKLADGNDDLRAQAGKVNISSDAANIFVADEKLNTARSNFSYINLKYGIQFMQSTLYNTAGVRTDNFVYRGYFAPTEKVRGEIARAQLYMLLMYPTNCKPGENFEISHMLEWNLNYPPTNERDVQRNDVLERVQKARNPFIDMPELGCKIFGNMDASSQKVCTAAAK